MPNVKKSLGLFWKKGGFSLLALFIITGLFTASFFHFKNNQAVSSQAQTSETSHILTLNGKTIPYKATVGIMPIYSGNHQVKATMSYIAYRTDEKNRPVTFVWCGGPGQSSLSENFYLSGPKIFNPATKTLENNPQTWLKYTDLVYIDMVGTGWGRPASSKLAQEIYSPEGDASTFTQFIETYLKENNRIGAKVYVVGESYGGIRASLVASNLLKDTIAIKGMILFSPELNDYYNHPAIFGSDMPYILSLPTFIRAALFYHKLNPYFQNNAKKTIKDGETWALNNYPVLLLKGDNLSLAERADLEAHLQNYTGLSAHVIRNAHYRISTDVFYKELISNQGKKIDYLDTRQTDYAVPYHGQYFVMSIESLMKSQLALYPVVMDYIKNTLKFSQPGRYINYAYPNGWHSEERYKEILSVLRSDMIINPDMKLYVGLGYYDADIPYMVNVTAINQLLLPASFRKNITVQIYEGGHMFYLDAPGIQSQLNKQIERLYV